LEIKSLSSGSVLPFTFSWISTSTGSVNTTARDGPGNGKNESCKHRLYSLRNQVTTSRNKDAGYSQQPRSHINENEH
jgi:hypothetical protein